MSGIRAPMRLSLLLAAAFFALVSGDRVLAQKGEQPLPAQLTPAAVGRVKQATVLLHVVASDGAKADGSGFFALKPGIIITNAHVLGMLSKAGGTPKSVEVVVNSGAAGEAKLTGTVVGVDRENDLAVVRVEGAKLPAPLVVETKRPLFETQKVYIFGFPFGVQLGKNITVSESSVSSLRTNGTETVQQVQVNGGIHPGNSGGPIVNSEGNVVAVSVSGIRGTQINFGIPADLVSGLTTGRVTESRLGEAVVEKGKVSVPVKFACLDPFAQVKEMSVEVWTGMPGQPLGASASQPKAKPGDSKREVVKLIYAKEFAQAEVTLPAIPEGQVCWLQPVMIAQDKKTQYGPAIATPLPFLPVERKPAKLAADFDKVKERTVKLKSVSTESFTRGKFSDVSMDKVEVDMLEVIVVEEKNTFIKISYGPATNIVSEINGKAIKFHNETTKMFRALPPQFIITPMAGLQSRISRNLNPKLPIELREDFLGCYNQFCSSIETAMVPIPKAELKPRGTFETRVALLVGGSPSVSGGKGDKSGIVKTVDLVILCTYEGVRTRNGREEALMSFKGQVKGRSKGTERAKGDVIGKYAVDVEGGFVSLVQIKVSTELESPGGEFRLTYALEVDVDRQAGNPLNIPAPRK